jgi:hypothetical protein
VKGVTVSRGPDLKRRPENLENKRKIGYSKEILLRGANDLFKRVQAKNSWKKKFDPVFWIEIS